ncbi:FMN-dependent NADH-azoreductase [Kosakonia oryzendophytica]|uniref:FMN dependent NADH:quinone oxidoreductase n=1 Tax=Kosakonia oryzendophytica TaxID=1005665 RepID=A0A1C4AHD9_9ENTR|nr:NAD(P)H-dependent oxidoreductase [Kosakonia oryzendophytica]AMO50114.1 NADH dehydrogenase [Enterobacter sp. FY-07]WBT57107.1 NAD(P)H-dependent oxidoreductase [Kosakonia oryzendophytica]SCB93909.1 FMN-dependent NADH-azoreductase [Kosakonia oryzendophytica]
MKILHIDSSILAEDSVTRHLSAETVRKIKEKYPNAQVTYRDVVHQPITHLTADIAAGFRPVGGTDASQTLPEHQVSQALVDEFLANELIVIGAPMYNFSVSTQLKAWLDRIAQPGKTFQYTSTGPVGLAGGKQIILVSARGGFYLQPPFAALDFHEKYLQGFFAFLGIQDLFYIRAEGMSKGEEVKRQNRQDALASIDSVIAALPPQ